MKVPTRKPDYEYKWEPYGEGSGYTCSYWFEEMIRNSANVGTREMIYKDGSLYDAPGNNGDWLDHNIQTAYKKWVTKRIEELVDKVLLGHHV